MHDQISRSEKNPSVRTSSSSVHLELRKVRKSHPHYLALPRRVSFKAARNPCGVWRLGQIRASHHGLGFVESATCET